MVKRHAEAVLSSWFSAKKRKPLIIRGARQVGKSTLVRHFAASNSLELCEINLEKHPDLNTLFASLDMPRILHELDGLVGKSIVHSGGILFLDEIQDTPAALPMLRYFYEEYPQLAVIAAGSLLEFTLNAHAFSMPVGRIQYFHLGPMSFKEFLLALGETFLIEQLSLYQPGMTISDSVHQKLLQRQREFMIVGGMPEAVVMFVESNSFVDVQKVQESIVSTFQDDFAKYTRTQAERLRLVSLYRALPKCIGRKIKYSSLSREDRSKDVKDALFLLSQAKLITLVCHSSCSGVPLDAEASTTVFKPLFLDIGLANRICGLDWVSVRGLDERHLIHEGSLAEQFIGQHLLYRDEGLVVPLLHYWVREESSRNAEIDYVVSSGQFIFPIEVKSGKSGSLRSLHQFIYHKKPKLGVRFDLNLPSLGRFNHSVLEHIQKQDITFNMLSLPLYLVEELPRLLTEFREEKWTL